MKQCAHCKEFKPLEEYAYSNKTLKNRQKHCRDCMRKFNRASYLKRSEEKKQQVKEDRQRKYDEARQFIWNYLSTHPCVNCGESNPIVLEFDHIREKKNGNIPDLAHNGYTIARLQEEIEKCQILCANCHWLKTHSERGWFSGVEDD